MTFPFNVSCSPLISLSPSPAKKKGNKKGKTLTLTDFLAEDNGSGGNAPPPQPSYAKSTSWADETDDLEGDGETHNMRSHMGAHPKLQTYQGFNVH